MRKSIVCAVAIVVTCLAMAVPAVWAVPGSLILNVPDWNQSGMAGYPSWCSPTAGGNLMGYWENVNGKVGLTDRLTTPGAAYANNPNTYQQGLYRDGQIEMGFYMHTDGWLLPNTQIPPGSIPPGTSLNAIGPGMLGYAAGAWIDPGASAIQKVAYAITQGKDTARNAAMWANYMAEINADRPVVCSFDLWIDTTKRVLPDWTIDSDPVPQQAIERYSTWDVTLSEGHTVVGVGYVDLTPGFQNNGADEFFVCQDGWVTTGQYVAVPVDTYWQQNDYVYSVDLPAQGIVPEPAGLTLFGLMLFGTPLVARRRRA